MYAIEKKDYNLVESVLRLFEPSKLKNIVKSATFDGSSCIKIAEGLKNDFQPETWKKLWSLLNSACNGQIPASLQVFWNTEDRHHQVAWSTDLAICHAHFVNRHLSLMIHKLFVAKHDLYILMISTSLYCHLMR